MLFPVAVLLGLAIAPTGTFQADSKAQPAIRVQGALVVGVTENREVEKGDAHDWQVAVNADEYVVLAVEILEVDVSIRVLTPANEQRRQADHSGYAGTLIVRWVAGAEPGLWTVRITPIGGGASGRYRIALRAKSSATSRDRQIVQADGLVEQAARHRIAGDVEEAERLLRAAIDIATDASGPTSTDVSGVLHQLAEVQHNAGRYGESVKLIERALRIDEQAFGPYSAEVGVALNNLGYMYQLHGRYQDAEPLLKRSLEIRANLLGADHPRTGVTMDNLAVLYISLGRFAHAEHLANRALQIFERQLGTTHYYVSFPLNILASIAQRQGRYAEAEPMLTRALDIDRGRLGTEHQNYAATLRRLALNALRLDRMQEAEDRFQATLAIYRKAHGPGHPTVADALFNLGRIQRLRGDYAAARALYEQVLVIERKTLGSNHPVYASTLVEMVRNNLASAPSDIAAARALIDEAIAVLDQAGGSHETRIDAYAVRADLHRREGRRAPAFADLAEAIRLVEELRPQISGSEETRASFLAHYASHFHRMTIWHAEAGDFGRAFEYAERGAARALLDQLAASQFDVRNSIPADVRAGLESRENAIKTRLAEQQHRITTLRSRATVLPVEEQAKRLASAETDLHATEREYVQVYVDIKNASPLWRDHFTADGRFASLASAQRELVPRLGLMLLYQIGVEESHVLVLPPAGSAPYMLPLRVQAETARALGIPAGSLTSQKLTDILHGVSGSQFGILDVLAKGKSPRGLTVADAPRADRLHALWQILIPSELRRPVLDATEVVIIPSGKLQNLPFEALVTTVNRSGVRYWLDDGPVVRYAPSATVLYSLSRRPDSRLLPQAGVPFVLTVSDPVYDAAEATIAVFAAAPAPTSKPTGPAALQPRTRNSYERFGGSLARLPGTALETDAIREAYGSEAARAVEALQQLGANEPAVRRALPGKRYVHLATHALVGGNRRALFASLALTPPASETATSAADGFLQLHEIYDLNLQDVELAVLSACDTNRGPNIDGESVFALSRGFMAVGARRVIASQWAVDDASTATLVGAVFRQVVEADRAGRQVDFGRALRDAKRAVRNRPEWADPYHWAPFVLTGRR